MLFRYPRKKNKTSHEDKKRLNRVDSVRVDKKRKILFLREKKWKIEFTKTDLKNFFKKNTYRISILTISAISVVVITLSSVSTAKVAQFYTSSCLGGWENPGNVEGMPQVFDGSGKVFDTSNSAILRNSMAEIFCGNFQAEGIDDFAIKKAVLKLSWQVGEKTGSTEEKKEIEISVDPKEEENIYSIEDVAPSDFLLDTEVLLLGTSSTSSISVDIDIIEEEKETTTIESDDFTSSLQEILDAPANIPVEFTLTPEETEPDSKTESTPEEEVTEEVETPAEPVEPTEPTEESDSDNVSFFKKISKTVFAAEVEEVGMVVGSELEEEGLSLDDGTTTIESNDFISSLQNILDVPSDNSVEFTLTPEEGTSLSTVIINNKDDVQHKVSPRYNDFLEIEYTFDSISWQHLGFVGTDNWRDIEFELPVVEWNELEKLQVRIKNLPTIDEQPTVYLDSMWIEVSHSKNKILKPAKLENLSKKKSFSINQEVKFEFEFREKERGVLDTALHPIRSVFYDRKFSVSKVQLINARGGEETVENSVEYVGENMVSIIINPNKRQVKPGKYILETYFKTDDGEIVLEQQEFYLGVLAINVDKSIYLPGERAYLQMAALTDTGDTICDAALWMSVIDPDEIERNFSTEDDTIHLSGECHGNNVTDVPDYFAYYDVNNVGTYKMKLINLDTGQEIEDSFEVKDGVLFDVERVGPTRIYPLSSYQVTINVTAMRDFKGDIVEYVPDSFEIIDTSLIINNGSSTMPVFENIVTGLSETEEETKEIIWFVDIQKGETITLNYEFDAPDISPEFYLLGPLEFYE